MAFQESVGLDFVNTVQAPRHHYNRSSPWPDLGIIDSIMKSLIDKSKGPYFLTWESSPAVPGTRNQRERLG
jgi:hypothetical protein